MTERYCGIDPGMSGAIVILSPKGELLEYHRMPLHTIKIGNKERKEVDIDAFKEILKPWESDIFVAIEEVHSMPKQGVVSTFTFGREFGKLLGTLDCLGLDYARVRSKEWHNAMTSHYAGTTKERANLAACSLWAELWQFLWNTKTGKWKGAVQGVADAALIAEYGRSYVDERSPH